jgi:hypothetical protein
VNDSKRSFVQAVSRTIVVLAASALAHLSSGSSVGQTQVKVYLGADATYSNRYVWRGLTRTSHKIFQLGAFVSVASGQDFFTFGGWASLEPLESDADQTSDTGVDEAGLGEFNYWFEYQRGFGLLDAAVGWTGYVFGNEATAGGWTSDFNTGEIYGRIELRSLPVSPKLAVWYDVDNVDGAYLETSADLQVPFLPIASLYVTGLAGWSLGQDVSGGNPTTGYFAEDGLTHVDLSAWTSFLIGGGFSIASALHVQFNRDASTKVTSAHADDSDRSTKVWFSLAVSWVHNLALAP